MCQRQRGQEGDRWLWSPQDGDGNGPSSPAATARWGGAKPPPVPQPRRCPQLAPSVRDWGEEGESINKSSLEKTQWKLEGSGIPPRTRGEQRPTVRAGHAPGLGRAGIKCQLPEGPTSRGLCRGPPGAEWGWAEPPTHPNAGHGASARPEPQFPPLGAAGLCNAALTTGLGDRDTAKTATPSLCRPAELPASVPGVSMEEGDCFKFTPPTNKKKGIASPTVTAGRNQAWAVTLNHPCPVSLSSRVTGHPRGRSPKVGTSSGQGWCPQPSLP